MTIPTNLDDPLPPIHPVLGMWPAARWLALGGIPVFPSFPSSKLPNTDQLGDGWKTTEIATTNVEQVDLWWGADWWSNPLVPLGMGPNTSGTVSLDCDYRNGLCPRTQLAERCRELGIELPPRPTVRSGSGEHWHFLLPDGVDRFPKRPDYIPGAVDVIATGGYLVMPPARVRVLGEVPDDIPDGQRNAYAERTATWRHYRWVKPGTPDPVDVYPEGPFAGLPATSPYPDLDPDDEWHPTIRELWEALGAAVLPEEVVADVLARPQPRKRSAGRSGPRGLSDGGLYQWEDGVPVDEWLERGLPPDLNHEACVKQAANALAGRGWTVEEITSALVHITDPRVTPLKKPEPWSATKLERKARESVAWVEERREAEAVANRKFSERWS